MTTGHLSEVTGPLLQRLLDQGYGDTLEYAAALADPSWPTLDDADRDELIHAKQAEIRDRYRDATAVIYPPFSDTATTVMFLDIDGVVSPLPSQNPYQFVAGGPCTFIQPNVPVRIEVINWLARQRIAGGGEMVWASSWLNQALSLTESMGTGPVRTVFGETDRRNKREAVTDFLRCHPHITRAVICEDNPYIIDDPDIAATVHCVTCDPYQGLTDGDLAYLDDLLARE